jgi:predicted RNase H-like HicB family nuclease
MKYIYPAVFAYDDGGAVNVNFPDFESCFTYGKNLADALDMAEDVLSLTIYDMEKKGDSLPQASDIRVINYPEDGFCTLIRCDTDGYKSYFSPKIIPSVQNNRLNF